MSPVEIAAFRREIRVEMLEPRHHDILAHFNCHDVIDGFLKDHAMKAAVEGFSQTHLLLHGPDVVGYVSLATNVVMLVPDEKQALQLSIPRKTWPAVLIGYLGVDRRFRGMGFGDDLLRLAAGEAHLLRERVGCRFLVADVYRDPHALALYERNGFIACKHEQHAGKREQRYFLDLLTNPMIDQSAPD